MLLEEQKIDQRGDYMNVIKMISKFNFYAGTIDRLKDGYIVIHYVGALGSAKENCQYYAGGNRNASAHYFVDFNGDVYQSVEDKNSAWHCGSTTGYKHPKCRNTNSIGIELCCRTTGDKNKADKNWYFEDATVSAAIELTKELMKKYNIPADHVIRHYDVTGKTCPAPYVFNTGKHTWAGFQSSIKGVTVDPGITWTNPENQNKETSQEDVDQIGWNAFLKAGFSEIVAAAFLGNLKAESSLKANNLQNSYEKSIGMDDETYTAAVDSGAYSKDRFYNDKAGYGLAQWTYWSRKKAMYEYIIGKSKKSIGDAKAQFDFLVYELSTSYSGLVSKLKSCKTIKEASDLILTQYEKPANQSDSVKTTRASYAQTFYDKLSGKSVQTGTNNSMLNETVPFLVDVSITDLNIRKGPGTDYAKIGKYTDKGRFTIVEVKSGKGANAGWGLLKSYQKDRNGWISLDYAKKV